MEEKVLGECIFCTTQTTSKTKPEHILLNAFGGRKTTRRVICSNCNTVFGGSIDRTAAEQLSDVRNLLQLKSGDLSPPPAITNLEDGDQKFYIDNSGQPQIKRKPFNLTADETSKITSINVVAKDKETLAGNIYNAARAAKIPEDKIADLVTNSTATLQTEPSPTIHLQWSFGGPELLRSLTKCCLVLWATKVGNSELAEEHYKKAKEYVTGEQNDFAKTSVFPDNLSLPFENQIMQDYSEAFTLIFVRSFPDGRVIAHVTLYNFLSWSIVLAEDGCQIETNSLILSNSLDPRKWSDELPQGLSIPDNWPTASKRGNHDDCVERINKMVALSQKNSQSRLVGNTVEDIFREYGPPEGEKITEAHWEAITTHLAHSLASSLGHVSHSRPIDISDVISSLKQDSSFNKKK